MANLATSWIQGKFKLPRPVSVIERDLSNGYILAQVARQCGAVDEDTIATVKDSVLPNDIIENFRVLSKALKTLNINVTKEVAINVISELPGAAADIVLRLKRQVESKGAKDSHNAYKESLATLRPHKFVRERELFSTLTPHQKFIDDAMKESLDTGGFKTIDMLSQLNHYETFKYTEDDKILKAISEVEKKASEDRTLKRQNEIAKKHQVMADNRQFMADIDVKWRETQQVKKNRQIRDMQFELATREIANMKKKNAADKHNVEQMDGIDAFEKNLIRNGIGAGEEGGALSTTYEDGLLFLNRIEKIFEKKGPSNDDINNFITQLKIRTKEKRAARYEKLRRKRRMLVEQQAMQAAAQANHASADIEGINDFQGDEELSAESIKRREKEAKYKANYEKCKEATSEILRKAAVVIDDFTDTTRKRYEETQERKKALESIELARQEKKAVQHQISVNVCEELVALLVSEVFDTIDNDRSHILQTMMTSKPLTLASTLVKSKSAGGAVDTRSTTAGPGDLAPGDIFKSDIWQPFVSCAINLAAWSVELPPAAVVTEEDCKVEVEENKEGAEAAVVEAKDDESSQPQNDQSSKQQQQPSRQPSLKRESSKTGGVPSNAKFVKTLGFTDKLKTLLEDLLVGLSGSASTSLVLDSLPFSKEEKDLVRSSLSSKEAAASPTTNTIQYVFLLQDGSQHFIDIDNMLNQVLGLFPAHSGINVDYFTAVKALHICAKLKPTLEAKAPISFGALCDVLMNCHSDSSILEFVCPAELMGTPLSAQALKITGDLLDVFNRVVTPANVAAMDVKKGFQLSALPFNETSFSVLIGEILYLRSYIIDKIKSVDKALYDAKCPHITLISLHNPKSAICHSWDSITELKVVDWLLRGGFRDGPFPDAADADLAAAFSAEGKASKAKKPAKGKEEVFVAANMIRNVIVLTSSKVPVTYDTSEGPANDFAQLQLSSDPDKITYALHYQRVKDLDLEKRKKAIKDFETSLLAYASKVGFASARIFTFKSLFTNANANTDTESAGSEADNYVDITASNASDNNEKIIKHAIKGSFEATEAILSCILQWTSSSSSSPAITADAAAAPIAISESDFLSDICYGKIIEVIDSRRNKLATPVKMLLLNAIGAKPLDKMKLWSVYLAMCDSESDMLDSFGNFLMMMGSYYSHVDLCLKGTESKLLGLLKSADPRWQADCMGTESAISALMQRREPKEDVRKMMLDDLVCRIGNTVDDRHMKALHSLNIAKAETEAVIRNTRMFVVDALNDIEEDMYRILNQRKEYVSIFCNFLEEWGYSELPFPNEFSKKSAEMKKNQLKTLITLFSQHSANSVDASKLLSSSPSGKLSISVSSSANGTNENNNNYNNNNNNNINNNNNNNNFNHNSGGGGDNVEDGSAPFSRLVASAADADSFVGSSPMMTSAYTELCCNLVDISSALSYSAHIGIARLTDLVAQMQARCTNFIKIRHSYEHRMLGNWSEECYSSKNKSFLSKYFFGVSSDSSFDGIPIPVDSSYCVNFGDFKLPLPTLKALAKSLFSDAFDTMAARVVDVTNSSPADAYLENIISFIAGAMERAEKSYNVSFPNSWNSKARILILLKSIDGLAFKSFATGGGLNKTSFIRYLRKLVLSLLYCHIAGPPPMNYISRLVKLLGAQKGELYELSSVASTVLTTVVLNDKKLSKAWWLDDGFKAFANKDTSDLIDSIFSTLIPCYVLDCASATKIVSVTDLLLDLCRSPQNASISVVSKLHIKYPDSQDLAFLDGGGQEGRPEDRPEVSFLPDLSPSNLGLFRAFMLSSLMKQSGEDGGSEGAVGVGVGETDSMSSMSCHSGLDLCSGAKVRSTQSKWLLSKLTLSNSYGSISNSNSGSSSSSSSSSNSVIELCATEESSSSSMNFVRSNKVPIVAVISELSVSGMISSIDSMTFATTLSEE